MKLLKKSVLNNEMATQRKQQIDEGISLAQKIDTLRQTLGRLESQHSAFLSKVKTDLENTTSDLQREIDSKRAEIDELEKQREQLLKPLDVEWEKLEKEKTLVQSLKESAEKKISESDDKDKKAEEKFANAREIFLRAERKEGEADMRLESSIENEEKSKLHLSTSEEKLANIESYCAEKIQESLSRDVTIAARERELDILQDSLSRKEQELKDKERLVDDKYATLQRTINRTK